jgi:hypothetical protein
MNALFDLVLKQIMVPGWLYDSYPWLLMGTGGILLVVGGILAKVLAVAALVYGTIIFLQRRASK